MIEKWFIIAVVGTAIAMYIAGFIAGWWQRGLHEKKHAVDFWEGE